jgi:hypothetical protein
MKAFFRDTQESASLSQAPYKQKIFLQLNIITIGGILRILLLCI